MLFEPGYQPRTTAASMNELAVSGDVDSSRPETVLHLASGRQVVVPTRLLLEGAEGEVGGAVASGQNLEGVQRAQTAAEGSVIPLVEEQLEVGKRTVTTGTVRLRASQEEFVQPVQMPLTRTEWEIDRVPVNQMYAERPGVRQEGDVTVYPLVQEHAVTHVEYMVLEEVRVRQVARATEHTEQVHLRRDVLVVDREPARDL